MRLPKMRRWAPRNLAYITVGGTRHYLGTWGTAEADRRWALKVKELLGVAPERAAPGDVTLDDLDTEGGAIFVSRVRELALAFGLWAREYYVKNGRMTNAARNVARVRALLRETVPRGRRSPADEREVGLADAAWLREVRAELVRAHADRLSRQTVNEYVRIVQRMFVFGADHTLLPRAVADDLLTVKPLKRGRPPAPGVAAARERRGQPFAPRAWIRKVRRHLGPELRVMLDLQLVTGMRPSEVCAIRPRDLERTKDPSVMIYRVAPEADKTDHVEEARPRLVYLGPRALRLLAMVWPPAPDDYFFSPARAYAAHRLRLRAARATTLYPSHSDDARRARRRAGGIVPRLLGDRYTRDSYRRALHRACDRARAEDEAAGVPEHERVRRFGPYRLRHERAGLLADAAGVHVTSELLGHASIQTTQLYLQTRVRERSAIRAAARFG